MSLSALDYFHQTLRGFFILHNIWVFCCRTCEWTSLTKTLSTHKHIHTRMRRQFTDVNAVTNNTMRGYIMANTVWKMLFLPLENQLQFLTVSSFQKSLGWQATRKLMQLHRHNQQQQFLPLPIGTLFIVCSIALFVYYTETHYKSISFQY